MNTRQKKKRMNMFLKRRGIPPAMNIREIAPVVHVQINKMYQVYIADRTRDSRKTNDNVIRGRRLTDQESADLAYAESMKTYTFDETLPVSAEEDENNA